MSEQAERMRRAIHQWIDERIDKGGIIGFTVRYDSELKREPEILTFVNSSEDVDELQRIVDGEPWYQF